MNFYGTQTMSTLFVMQVLQVTLQHQVKVQLHVVGTSEVFSRA